jgi:hypothetical protein
MAMTRHRMPSALEDYARELFAKGWSVAQVYEVIERDPGLAAKPLPSRRTFQRMKLAVERGR